MFLRVVCGLLVDLYNTWPWTLGVPILRCVIPALDLVKEGCTTSLVRTGKKG